VDQLGIATFVVAGSYAVRLPPAGQNKNPPWLDNWLVGAGLAVQVVLNK
jgi:hypothetical protein